MNIAVDAMGGDVGVFATVEAARKAAAKGIEITLVGRASDIEQIIGPEFPPRLHVVHAPEVVSSDDQPVAAVRKKKDSSLVMGIDLIKQGQAAALVSAGNTGALLVAGKLKLGNLSGIERPALGAMLPTVDRAGCFMLDLGAVTDVRPIHLLHYAIMADAFVRLSREVSRPRIALLNVGAEAVKGTDVYRQAHEMLSESKLNFVGNIEGRELLSGRADVVVCDGFVGNIMLKFAEGMSQTIFSLLKKEIARSPVRMVAAMALKGAFSGVKGALDYREYGGAPLLGVNGIIVKCHGSSNVDAIFNGILSAKNLAERNLVAEIAKMTAETAGEA